MRGWSCVVNCKNGTNFRLKKLTKPMRLLHTLDARWVVWAFDSIKLPSTLSGIIMLRDSFRNLELLRMPCPNNWHSQMYQLNSSRCAEDFVNNQRTTFYFRDVPVSATTKSRNWNNRRHRTKSESKIDRIKQESSFGLWIIRQKHVRHGLLAYSRHVLKTNWCHTLLRWNIGHVCKHLTPPFINIQQHVLASTRRWNGSGPVDRCIFVRLVLKRKCLHLPRFRFV
jgi:hypothetical protein